MEFEQTFEKIKFTDKFYLKVQTFHRDASLQKETDTVGRLYRIVSYIFIRGKEFKRRVCSFRSDYSAASRSPQSKSSTTSVSAFEGGISGALAVASALVPAPCLASRTLLGSAYSVIPITSSVPGYTF